MLPYLLVDGILEMPFIVIRSYQQISILLFQIPLVNLIKFQLYPVTFSIIKDLRRILLFNSTFVSTIKVNLLFRRFGNHK